MQLPELPFPTSIVLLYCLPIAATLIYLPFGLVAYGRFQFSFTDALSNPRLLTEKLPAFAQRASGAHQNGFETFTPFATAVLMAYVTDVQSVTAAWAAIAFVFARLLYPIFYIANIPPLRSLMFGIGSLSTLILFVLSLMQVTK